MNQKKQAVLFGTVATLLATTMLSFAFTTARYSEEAKPTEGGYIGGDIEYILSEQLEVASVEEFFAAIENGYSNIKLRDDIENPLIITSGMKDVNADLIIDLNGHDLQRNNREPILNIIDGVKVAVIDSSEKQTGSLYNPVGSVLSVGGGTLTVMSGEFESGPRKEEYLSQTLKNGVIYNKGHGTFLADQPVRFYKKEAGKDSYTETVGTSFPIIQPYSRIDPVGATPSGSDTHYWVNGNIYLDQNYSSHTEYLKKDVYLYYVTDDSSVSFAAAQSNTSADFYYEYYTTKVEAETKDSLDYAYAGYKNGPTIVAADGTTELADLKIDPMTREVIEITPKDGMTEYFLVRVYGYYQDIYTAVNGYDGTGKSPNFAAIKMQSGTLDVMGGSYHSWFGVEQASCVYASGGYLKVDNGTFEAIENGVCINCSYDDSTDPTTEYLQIETGKFSSQLGDTIQVNSGKILVNSGTFEKDASVLGTAATTAGENNSAIHVSGGTLTAKNAEFIVQGNYVYGINSEGAGTEVGSVTVTDSVFSMTGENVRGINASAGTVTIGGQDPDTSLASGTVTFYIDHVKDCYGVYAKSDTSDELLINLYSGDFFLGQGKGSDGDYYYTTEKDSTVTFSAGIYVNAANANINVQKAQFVSAGSYSAGIFAEKGTVEAVGSIYSGGITFYGGALYNGYANGGRTDENSAWITIPATGITDFTRTAATGVFGIKALNGAVSLTSFIVDLNAEQSSGVLVSGAQLTIDFLSANIVDTTTDTYSTAALNVENGNVEIGVGIVETDGLCITVQGGDLTFMDQATLTADNTTAIYVSGGSVKFFGSTANITSTIEPNGTTNTAIPWKNDGSLHYNGIEVVGGSFTSEAETFEMTFTGLQNDLNFTSSDEIARFMKETIKSYAISVSDGAFEVTKKLSITSTVGGGVKVSGGDVTIGDSSSALTDITVKTTGQNYQMNGSVPDYYNPISTLTHVNWRAPKNMTGGYALEVNGGNLEVFNGTFEAALGNAITVKSGESSVVPSVVIHDGIFNGYLTDFEDNISSIGMGKATGPGVYYGLKVMGGCDISIYGGTFFGGNGGAFITGIYEITSSGTKNYKDANVYVYAGDFKGTFDGFNIYDASNVVFGAYTRSEIPSGWGQTDYQKAITVQGSTATLALNPLYESAISQKVWIYYGSYNIGSGNYQAAGTLTIYNTNTSLLYTLTSGHGTINNNTEAIYFRDNISSLDFSFSYNASEFSVKTWNDEGLPSKINCGSDTTLTGGQEYSMTITAKVAVKISTKWGVYQSGQGVYRYEVFDKNGTSKGITGSTTTDSLTSITIELAAGEYVVFTYTPPSGGSGMYAHGYLDSITYSYA